MNKPLVKVGYLGLLVIFLMIVLQITFFVAAGKMSSAMMHFSFAKSPSDVLNIFYEGGFDHQLIGAVNAANLVDFPFMAAFSVFLLSFLYHLYTLIGEKVFYYALSLPVLAFTGDLFENIQMYSILGSLIEGGYETNIVLMQFFTYLKWLALAMSFLVLGWFYIRKQNTVAHILGAISGVPILAGIIALFSQNLQAELFFANTVIISFGIAIAYCFLYEDQTEAELR